MNALAGFAGIGVATLILSPTPDPRSTPGHVLDVVLPLPVAECKCNAKVEFNPTNGAILCLAPQQGKIGMQVIWQTPTPTKGNCRLVSPDGEGGPNCEDIANAVCTANIAPLDITLYNCWSAGIYLTATGLQSGQRFWFTNDSEVEFDPDLSATCKKAAPAATADYEITVYDAPSGSNPIDSFKITLTCEACTIQ